MLPLMAGMPAVSVLSGQLISWTGRYKALPLAGTAVMAIALFLLSRMTPATSIWAASMNMLLLGVGLGLVLQAIMIAVQNAVDYRDLGVATSGAILFRFIGGSLGTAVMGTIFASQLEAQLGQRGLADGAGLGIAAVLDPQAIAQMPPAIHAAFSAAVAAALSSGFLVAAFVAAAGFVVAWALPERPLRQTIAAASETDVGGNVGNSYAMPTDSDSLSKVLRGLTALSDRDLKRKYISSIISRAGLDLNPTEAWLLLHLDHDPCVELQALSQQHHIEAGRLQSALWGLRNRDLVKEISNGLFCRHDLTEAGLGMVDQLAVARQQRLQELFADWSADQRVEVAQTLQWISQALAPRSRHSASRSPEPRSA
jgi:hypothetical protein